jgi:hypothetical protein
MQNRIIQTEIIYSTVTMFLALAVLVNWKHRRDVIAARLNRGLCGYVAAEGTVRLAAPEWAHGKNLIPV